MNEQHGKNRRYADRRFRETSNQNNSIVDHRSSAHENKQNVRNGRNMGRRQMPISKPRYNRPNRGKTHTETKPTHQVFLDANNAGTGNSVSANSNVNPFSASGVMSGE